MTSQVLVAVVVPAMLAVGWLARRRYGVEVMVEATASISVIATVTTWGFDPWVESDRAAALAGLVELAALLVVILVGTRGGRQPWRGPGAALAAGMAVAIWPSRFDGFRGPGEVLTLMGFGALFALPAALAGVYLRWMDEGQRRSVAAARRAQRIELAHELHDFVAHDVSGMVAQAQAGMVLAATDPARAAALFERIEAAGQQALLSLDRTVHLLRTSGDEAGAERGPQPGIAELADLTRRFTESGSAEVRLLVPEEPPGIPRETAATAYRIVVEALTNVRRHAPAAQVVDVAVRCSGQVLRVTVTDDGGGTGSAGSRRRRGGSGLAGLAARVEALGGTLLAGRSDDGRGWQVSAVIPLEGR